MFGGMIKLADFREFTHLKLVAFLFDVGQFLNIKE